MNREESVEVLLERLAEAMERDGERVREYVGVVVRRMLGIEGVVGELGRVVRGDRGLQERLQIRIEGRMGGR